MRHAATRRGVDHRHGNSDLLLATTSKKSLYAAASATLLAAAVRLNPSLADGVPLPTKMNAGKEFLGAQPPVAAAAAAAVSSADEDDVAAWQPSGPPLLVGGTPFNYYERDGTTMDGVNLNDGATYYPGNDAFELDIDVGCARYDVEGMCYVYIM